MLGRAAAWSLGVPAVVHTVHGAPFHPYQGRGARLVFQACERWAARRCHAMVSVADAMTDLMVDAGVAPREKFTTVYSGMEVEPFLRSGEHRDRVRQELGYRPEHVVIGKIARLFKLKGHDDVIRAARSMIAPEKGTGPICATHPKGRHQPQVGRGKLDLSPFPAPNVRFLFIGDGVLRGRLQQQIAAAGLTDYFQFTGLVPPERIPELLAATDIVVHASLREGLARVLPQALIAGKPVVSYDVDGAREVVISDETGFLIPPRNIEAACRQADAARRRFGVAGSAGRRRPAAVHRPIPPRAHDGPIAAVVSRTFYVKPRPAVAVDPGRGAGQGGGRVLLAQRASIRQPRVVA